MNVPNNAHPFTDEIMVRGLMMWTIQQRLEDLLISS